MPRTGALLPLSREHHASLVLARTARRAADSKNMTACSAAMIEVENHWHTLLATHFEEEERLMRLAVDVLDSESVLRISAEHAELRMLACGPCQLGPVARLYRFSDLIVTHVRYEERTLFPQLQLFLGKNERRCTS
ncbi:hypothetical protein SAMN05216419_100369 [Nitrosomonas cryotolerans]|uniref:Hemerythrin HHE cation binding domain-containing protein n=1 Tax=Nitrosomonas cryotolerans ATCC 49181 TaxID=1131553 RepID=A0A1N6J6J6_9PROT|nr:hypothetical protein [Nitrosomonas cryotolerans]SFP45401.1 hypothetical protein SAMN05216419_100369 [Nitrosomonas cryotolerans]SIO39917.1 hypothetical protein SAMN02743940_2349 [Nitrosomonas cryotolerans ATCC 49181]